MANYTTAWDETLPPGSESKSLGDNRIKELKNQIRERLATEHSTITEEVGDAKLLHLPGKTSVLYYGTTTQINALTGMSEGALAFDTTIGALKIYTSSAWTVLPFDWDGMWGGGDAVHTHSSDTEGGTLSISAISAMLGAWDSKAVDTVYQAATDGFVCAAFTSIAQDRVCRVVGYTDGSNPPTTARASAGATWVADIDSAQLNSFTMPVKKGAYYKVAFTNVFGNGAYTLTIYWIPLGS